VELRQLRYFVTVAQEGSFTRAAARLHLSQQSLSAAVQRLEAQLGCPLLERGPRRVVPTAPGAALLARARALRGYLRPGAEPDLASVVSTPVSGQATMTDRVLRGEGCAP